MTSKVLASVCAIGILSGCTGREREHLSSRQQAEIAAQPFQPAPADRDVVAIAIGDADSARHAPIYAQDIVPLLDKYCLNCHGGETAEAGVVLDKLSDGPLSASQRSLLLRVADNLHSLSMPPEAEPAPDRSERTILFEWINATAGPEARDLDRVTVRRLNRTEYNNTVRDLVGLDLRPAQLFPDDDIGYGFDNIGEVLAMPTILVEKYLAAADAIVARAFSTPEIRTRLLNPPTDVFPLVFRRYKPPVRAARVDKTLRTAGQVEDPELARQQRIYNILRAFADRAWRRPATHDEVMSLLGIVTAAEKDDEDFESALQLAFRAILASCRFLVRIEHERPAHSSPDALPANDFGLASRLSYFLWSSMPDDELSQLAATGTLRKVENLRAQAKRMLNDPKSHDFLKTFAAQWLQIRRLEDYMPDSDLFPDFDPALRSAMVEETALFCQSIQHEDRSILDFLTADYSFVNERLARHYGINGVSGDQFRRVSLSGTSRGGVLTHASILTATSHPTRTSPVKRGKWILDNILGAPPAPPPSGVEALREEQGIGPAGTLRHRMERHRSDPSCSSCHRRMDPLGFSLENFDAIGGWRTRELESPIDVTGRLPGGRDFEGPSGLRSALNGRANAFARCLAEKMLTVALGRGLDRADQDAVDRIVDRLARDNYRFTSLVLAVIESQPFREPRQPEGKQ